MKFRPSHGMPRRLQASAHWGPLFKLRVWSSRQCMHLVSGCFQDRQGRIEQNMVTSFSQTPQLGKLLLLPRYGWEWERNQEWYSRSLFSWMYGGSSKHRSFNTQNNLISKKVSPKLYVKKPRPRDTKWLASLKEMLRYRTEIGVKYFPSTLLKNNHFWLVFRESNMSDGLNYNFPKYF